MGPRSRSPKTARLVVAVCVLIAVVAPARTPVSAAPSDLDAFMRQVLAKRDDNWKKLQQYILDEREKIELRGPGHLPIWGDLREYTWYVRDGYFVRSPLKFNGGCPMQRQNTCRATQPQHSTAVKPKRVATAATPRPVTAHVLAASFAYLLATIPPALEQTPLNLVLRI